MGDLWDAVFFCFFFLLLQRGRVEVIEEIKEARREGGGLKAAAHTSASMIHLFLTYFLQAILIICRGREVGSFFGRTFY